MREELCAQDSGVASLITGSVTGYAVASAVSLVQHTIDPTLSLLRLSDPIQQHTAEAKRIGGEENVNRRIDLEV